MDVIQNLNSVSILKKVTAVNVKVDSRDPTLRVSPFAQTDVCMDIASNHRFASAILVTLVRIVLHNVTAMAIQIVLGLRNWTYAWNAKIIRWYDKYFPMHMFMYLFLFVFLIRL